MQNRKLRRYQRMVHKNPGDLHAWCGLGAALVEAGESGRAASAFTEALHLATRGDYCLAIGDLASKHRMLSLAKESYRRALALDSDLAQSAIRLARLHIDSDEPQDAWSILVGQLPKHPHSRDVHFLLAIALERLEEFEEAQGHAESVIARNPEDVLAFRASARIADKLHQYTRSADHWRRVVDLVEAPTFEDLTGLGVALANCGRHRDALGLFELAARRAPDRVDAHANLGTALLSIEDHAGARRSLERALTLDPNNAHARCMLGTVCQREGHLEEAVELFRAAAGLAPRWTLPLFNAATALIELGRPTMARGMLEEASRIDANDAQVRAALISLLPAEAPGAAVGMTGDLQTFRLPDLLEMMRLRMLSGTLSLVTIDGEGTLTLRDGALTAAQSPASRRLGDILVEKGFISTDALAEALRGRERLSASEQLRLGEHLLRGNYVPGHLLRKALTEQITEALRDMLDWQDGQFVFRRSEIPPEPNPVLEFDAQSMILDAARYTDELRRRSVDDS